MAHSLPPAPDPRRRTAYADGVKKLQPLLLVDIVLVLAFSAFGRRSHDEGLDLTGVLTTAWPFLAGLALGWIVNDALYKNKSRPLSVVPGGIVIFFCTMVGGMLLRVLSDQGTALSFILVADIVLAVFLLGWRAIYAAVVQRSATR